MLLSVDVDKIFTSWVLAMRKLASITWLFVKEIVTQRLSHVKKIPSSSFATFASSFYSVSSVDFMHILTWKF